ncbi:hypothetical protein, partial [Pseudomonas syringae]|uniref:hypothetical protein n=1 Tax=Pseudomonas syringae TaxID=317 RepID=UPI00195D8260
IGMSGGLMLKSLSYKAGTVSGIDAHCSCIFNATRLGSLSKRSPSALAFRWRAFNRWSRRFIASGNRPIKTFHWLAEQMGKNRC